jgi:hypothetical protein
MDGVEATHFFTGTALGAAVAIDLGYLSSVELFLRLDLRAQDKVKVCGINIAVSQDRILCQ